MKIAIGSDHAGFALKESLAGWLRETGTELQDLGTYSAESVDYPDIAAKVCELVVAGQAERGILVCGSGIGMSIAANKIAGVRAALVHDEFTARRAREHNHCNVLCLGTDLVGEEQIRNIVTIFLSTPFSDGRHTQRIAKISEYEKQR